LKNLPVLPDIPESEKTPLVLALLGVIDQLIQTVQQQAEEIDLLKDEINILKGEKKRPTFKGSKLEQKTKSNKPSGNKKRAGSKKKNKNSRLTIHQDVIIKPDQSIPDGSRFKGYRDFIVQELNINMMNRRFRLERWITPDQQSIMASLPSNIQGKHFGPQLISYILYQHHHCHTTQPLLLEQLLEWGVDISSGQINRILLDANEPFHEEKDQLLHAGLKHSSYITVDDSGARHQGKNGFVTQVGNPLFCWFQSTYSKSRINFLGLLRAGQQDYCLNESALAYMKTHSLPQRPLAKIMAHKSSRFESESDWLRFIDRLFIDNKRHRRIATEGALIGSLFSHGFCEDLVIVSDDAGQFNVLTHALCWVHSERLIHKLIPLNESHREDIAKVREQIWQYYSALKDYKHQPCPVQADALRDSFDDIFTQKTHYEVLNQTLKRIYKNKDELLQVLTHPDIPLHTNGSETDIRDYVKKRKISGGTRSDEGRRCRDTFASLKKTCRKLDISFWKYLTCRLGIGDDFIPPLGDIVAERANCAPTY